MRFNSKIFKRISAAFLIILGIGFLFPLLWLFLTSFKDNTAIYNDPLGLPPVWLFENYMKAFTKFDFMKYFFNSVIYAGCGTMLVLILVTMFTYATARMDFKGADKLQKFLQFGLVIPGGSTLLGIYTILLNLGLKNTYQGLILVYVAHGIPIAAVIMYGFFRSLPFSMEEAAALDGAGTFMTFFRVILPMVTPALSTVAVTSALTMWNEYTLASILLDSNKLKSLPVGIQSFMTARGGDWGGMAAALILACIPTIVLYLCFSEQLENALVANSGMK